MVIAMNNSYLHYEKNNLNKFYVGILSILVIFGFFKNGILVYKGFSSNFIILFKPLLFPLISIIISCIFEYLLNKKITITDNTIYLLLLSMIIPVNTSIIIYTILIIIFNILLNYIFNKINLKINYIALFKLILVVIFLLNNTYDYANNLEVIKKYSYDLIDIFIGRGISGVNSSSILLTLIGYLILSINYYYKKDIPLLSFITYLILALLFKVIFNKVIIINSLIIFSLVFIAPLNKFSPAVKKERIIYSLAVGFLTFIFTYYISMYDGVTLAILITSILNYLNLK
jgi:hypothetical protein